MLARCALASILIFSLVQAPAARAGEMILRVLSYNIQGLVWPAGYRHDRYRKIGQRLATRRSQGNAPHVVVLQESFHDRTRELNQAARYPYAIRGPKGSLIRTSAGLRILSDFPMEKMRAQVFSACSGSNCLARKGIVAARLRIPGLPQALDIYTTHMDATTLWNDQPLARKTRLKQIEHFGRFFRAFTPANLPAILAGDYNFRVPTPESAVWNRELKTTFATGFCAENPQVCEHDEDPAADMAGSVDHQMYRPGSSVTMTPVWFERNFEEVVDGTRLSDHRGHEVHYLVRW